LAQIQLLLVLLLSVVAVEQTRLQQPHYLVVLVAVVLELIVLELLVLEHLVPLGKVMLEATELGILLAVVEVLHILAVVVAVRDN
jgi:hypothetical protein